MSLRVRNIVRRDCDSFDEIAFDIIRLSLHYNCHLHVIVLVVTIRIIRIFAYALNPIKCPIPLPFVLSTQ